MFRHALLVIAVALACRLALYVAAPPGFATATADSGTYDVLARNLARYHVYSEATATPTRAPAAERGPGYPAFAAAVYALCGQRPALVVLAQILLNSLLCGLLFVWTAARLGRVAGMAAGLVLALDLPSAVYANMLLTESLSSAFVLLTVMLVVGCWRSPKGVLWAFGAGACAAGAIYVRTAMMFWPLVLAACTTAALWREPSKAARCVSALLVGLSLAALPWVGRNYVVFREIAFSSGAGNCLLDFNAVAVVAARDHLTLKEAARRIDFEVAPLLRRTPQGQFQDSRLKVSVARSILASDAVLTAKLFANCFLRTLFGPCRGLIGEVFGASSGAVMGASVVGSLVLALAAWGLWRLAVQPNERPLALLLCLSLLYAPFVAFLQGYSRFRVPFLPLVALLAGVAVQQAWAAHVQSSRVPARETV